MGIPVDHEDDSEPDGDIFLARRICVEPETREAIANLGVVFTDFISPPVACHESGQHRRRTPSDSVLLSNAGYEAEPLPAETEFLSPVEDGEADCLRALVTGCGDDHGFGKDDSSLGDTHFQQLVVSHDPHHARTFCRHCPSKALRLLIVALVGLMFFLDTCAMTIVVPLVPSYFNRTDIEIGVMFGTKAAAQIIANPFWGRLIDRLGGMLALFLAAGLYVIALLLHAFAAHIGSRYAVVIAGRALLGIASAAVGTGGPALIASIYLRDDDRGAMMGAALGGYALGAMAGAPIGGAVSSGYDVEESWQSVFLALCGLTVVALVYMLALWTKLPVTFRCPAPSSDVRTTKPTPLWRLLTDPHILLVVSMACMANMAVSALDPVLPVWADNHFSTKPSKWQEGIVFLPLFSAYFVTTPILGRYIHRLGKWFLSATALLIGAVFIAVIPFMPADNFWLLLIPMTGLGVGMGVIDIVTYPMVASLMDARHSATYGNVYALSDIAFSLNYLLAPILATGLAQGLGYDWAFFSLAILLFAWLPLTLVMRQLERRQEALKLSRSKPAVSLNSLHDGV